MKITEAGTYRPTSKTKKTNRSDSSSGVDFADFMDAEETAAPARADEVAKVGGVNPLLSLQEISEEESANRQALSHGNKQLQMLERLRDAILLGRVPPHVLRDLERSIAAQKHKAFDPRLKDILAEIDLRVAVELAKLEVAERTNIPS